MGFCEELRDGYEYQRLVAQHFLDEGWVVYLPPLRVRPTFEMRAEYSDEYDMLIAEEWGADPLRVEVKSRNDRFTSPKDYRFGRVFVEEEGSYDRRGGPADLYVLRSRPTGGMMFLLGETADEWGRMTKMVAGRRIRYVTAPRRLWTAEVQRPNSLLAK